MSILHSWYHADRTINSNQSIYCGPLQYWYHDIMDHHDIDIITSWCITILISWYHGPSRYWYYHTMVHYNIDIMDHHNIDIIISPGSYHCPTQYWCHGPSQYWYDHIMVHYTIDIMDHHNTDIMDNQILISWYHRPSQYWYHYMVHHNIGVVITWSITILVRTNSSYFVHRQILSIFKICLQTG